jgi:hypothetical protein
MRSGTNIGITFSSVSLSIFPNSFPLVTIIANSPQLWVSAGYLLVNNQVTLFWMEKEWRSYYLHSRLPRVSFDTNEPGTRPTRWLQLPYWVTACLMLLSVVLHWLASQTLNVTETIGAEGRFVLNYSPQANLYLGVLVLVLQITINIVAVNKVETWMPPLRGSVRLVLYYCSRLPATLPSNGIAWGDISSDRERFAGFGATVRSMVLGVTYPSIIMAPEHTSSIDPK